MKREVDVEGYLGKVEPELREVVRGLRRTILDAVPGVEETVKWGNLTYEMNGIVCAIVIHKGHVNLQLWRGTELADPEDLLEGTGKSMRHVTVGSPGDIKRGPIKALIKQAARLNASQG